MFETYNTSENLREPFVFVEVFITGAPAGPVPVQSIVSMIRYN